MNAQIREGLLHNHGGTSKEGMGSRKGASQGDGEGRRERSGPGARGPRVLRGQPLRKPLKEIVHNLIRLIVWKVILRGLTEVLEGLESVISTRKYKMIGRKCHC